MAVFDYFALNSLDLHEPFMFRVGIYLSWIINRLRFLEADQRENNQYPLYPVKHSPRIYSKRKVRIFDKPPNGNDPRLLVGSPLPGCSPMTSFSKLRAAAGRRLMTAPAAGEKTLGARYAKLSSEVGIQAIPRNNLMPN